MKNAIYNDFPNKTKSGSVSFESGETCEPSSFLSFFGNERTDKAGLQSEKDTRQRRLHLRDSYTSEHATEVHLYLYSLWE